ncbi:MAG: molybdopterin-dependent oxidoreductase [Deltaproteobacteria bacterium]|nr:molybdopterin-dependent oxidoreductase [Deltaproteobacteria bacterium]
MAISRRTFIKIGGATVAAGALGGIGWRLLDQRTSYVPDPQTAGDLVVPSFCEICFWKCGILAHVKDGRVTKLEGNPDHPLSRGRLCPRGTGGMGLLYDPDRLQRPLVRRDVRGKQDFEEVSWEVALDRVAQGMDDLRKKYGPESLALFNHGYGASWFQQLVRAYGTDNIAAPSHGQCRGSRETAFQLTYGAGVGSPEILDIENTRVLTLIGSHLGENMHNTQVQEMADAIGKGGELVVVDPRFSVAAGKARYWLPIRPGTDLALLLAWMHVIVNDRLYDRDYLDKYALGFDKLVDHVAYKTPEWAAVETGIAPGLIVETARFIAGARPASLVHPGRRANWYGDDTQRGRAIAILNALLGTWGRRGGFFLPTAMALPKVAPPVKVAHTFKPAPDAPLDRPVPFSSEPLANGLRDASLPGARVAYPIKGWLVYGTNLVQALPEPSKTIAALEALDHVVAVDVLPAEITGWADVVLPEATYLERFDDLHAPPWKEGYVAIRQPVVPPLYDSKPGSWIAYEIGKRLGLADQLHGDVEAYLDQRLRGLGSSLTDMKRRGVLHPATREPVFIEDGIEPTFDTPSGKIEIFSQQIADAGLDPLPVYTPPEAGPAGSFRLLVGRAPAHTFGRTTNNRFLSRVYDENVLWLNAARADELGIHNGDRVVLTNQDGVRAGPIAVRATQAIRPDCVYMVHGFGHTAHGLSFARDRGVDDNQLCTRIATDPLMGGTGINVNFVSLEKVMA